MDAEGLVTSLASCVNEMRPLVEVLPAPVAASIRLPAAAARHRRAATGENLTDVLGMLAAHLELPKIHPYVVEADAKCNVFEDIVGERIGAAAGLALDMPHVAEHVVARISDSERARDFDATYRSEVVASFDGTPIKVHRAGYGSKRPVVLASACGMPARLCRNWLEELRRQHPVITWETRGMSKEGFPRFDDRRCSVEDQARDLIAIVDHYELDAVHLMGVCGGAVIALAAAALAPERVHSLSLWHGDYELGEFAAKTDHQLNLSPLMQAAAESHEGASALRQVVCSSALGNVPRDQAHLLLYPFASDALLYRYGRLNGNIMSTNVADYLPRIVSKTLVVTSKDDTTAHPEGSFHVARLIRDAELVCLPHGDHLSFFGAPMPAIEVARRFLGAA